MMAQRGFELWGFLKQCGNAQRVSGQHRNVLLPIDRISDGAYGNGSTQYRFPENFSGVRIESPEPSIQVSPENQAAGRGN